MLEKLSPGSALLIMLLALGAVQGLVYGSLLFRSKNENKVANRFLAVILFIFSYRLIVQCMRLFGLGYYDGWYYVMLDLSWVNGALLYFYIKALLNPNTRLKKTDTYHFLPVVLQIGISIFVRIQNIYWDGTPESISFLGYWGYSIWMNKPTIYLIASALLIIYAFKSFKLIKEVSGSITIDSARIRWIHRILYSFCVFFILVFVVLLSDLFYQTYIEDQFYFYFTRFYYYPFFGGLSVLTYWLGFEGYKRRDEKGILIKTDISEELKKQLEALSVELDKKMKDDFIYKNPKLSVSAVAEALGVKPYLINKCMSDIKQEKFNDYINAYRVEEVKRMIEEPKNNAYTLLSIAFDAGFNSKSSFNRAVKKHLGISPSELRQE